MNRAIATFGLIGLLSAGLLAAADGTQAVATGEPAGLCAVSTPSSEVPGVPPPVPRNTCSAVAYCPDGSQVSCYSGTFDLCETVYSCNYSSVECGVRCLNNHKYCIGYNQNNCSC